MQILSYILSFLGFLSFVCTTLIKGEKMKQILFLVFCCNFFYATSYLVAGSGINGAASCYLGALLAIINYFFDSRNKPIPKWLMALYALSFIAVNIAVGGLSYLVLIAIVATLIFVISIGQKNGAGFRFWTIFNLALWCLYDVLSASYGALVAHVVQMLFTVIGMLVHDRKKENKTVSA